MDDQSTATNPSLTYEETPIIQPAPETAPVQPAPQASVQPRVTTNPPQELPDPLSRPELPSHTYTEATAARRTGGGGFRKILAVIILFGVGFGGSIVIRQFLAGGFATAPTETTQEASNEPTQPPEEPPAPLDPFADWKTYEVLSGVTRLPVPDVSYKLPAEVLDPICDGANCASQGTYLPGDTRLTVAARGRGQLLADYRGKAISDVGGKVFESKETTVAGKPAIAYTGSFIGTTVGGYAFSAMRGVMIEVTDSVSLEINHFTPNGLTADFAADDALFDKILETVVIGGVQSTPTESVSPAASPSGEPSL